MIYYSGCNYLVDHEGEKFIGTATSMHECGDCDKLIICNLKKTEEVWRFNKEIEKCMNEQWELMNHKSVLL